MTLDITLLGWAIILNLALANAVMINKIIKEVKLCKNVKGVKKL